MYDFVESPGGGEPESDDVVRFATAVIELGLVAQPERGDVRLRPEVMRRLVCRVRHYS